jgi:hypothetical protein
VHSPLAVLLVLGSEVEAGPILVELLEHQRAMQEAWPERLIRAREHQWVKRAERSGLPARQKAPHIAGALAAPGRSHLTPKPSAPCRKTTFDVYAFARPDSVGLI